MHPMLVAGGGGGGVIRQANIIFCRAHTLHVGNEGRQPIRSWKRMRRRLETVFVLLWSVLFQYSGYYGR